MPAAPETGSEFLDGLLQQTPQRPAQPVRGQNYNYPLRAYLKPGGDVQWLQGDPNNRAMYQDMGYRLLAQTPGRDGGLSEEQQYVQVEYPKILKEQREKAALINAIRRAAERYRDIALQLEFDDETVDEIRDYLKQIKEETGKDIRVIMPRSRAARESAEDEALMRGVETSETASIEGLQSKLERGQGMIQGTGYDPTVESRRRTLSRIGAKP